MTMRGPFEVLAVTLNTFWVGVRGSAFNITLDFNGLQKKRVNIGCWTHALGTGRRLTRSRSS